MWHTTRETCINDCTYIFKAPIISNHCPLMLWHASSYLRTNLSPFSFTMPTLPARLQHAFFKMENSLFTPHLNELFNLWNNTVWQMSYWVCTAGRYRSTSILERFHAAFFNCHQFWCNDLHAWWDHLSENDYYPGPGVWEGHTVAW